MQLRRLEAEKAAQAQARAAAAEMEAARLRAMNGFGEFTSFSIFVIEIEFT